MRPGRDSDCGQTLIDGVKAATSRTRSACRWVPVLAKVRARWVLIVVSARPMLLATSGTPPISTMDRKTRSSASVCAKGEIAEAWRNVRTAEAGRVQQGMRRASATFAQARPAARPWRRLRSCSANGSLAIMRQGPGARMILISLPGNDAAGRATGRIDRIGRSVFERIDQAS